MRVGAKFGGLQIPRRDTARRRFAKRDDVAGVRTTRSAERRARRGGTSVDFECRNNSSGCSDCRVHYTRDVQLELSMLLEAGDRFPP